MVLEDSFFHLHSHQIGNYKYIDNIEYTNQYFQSVQKDPNNSLRLYKDQVEPLPDQALDKILVGFAMVIHWWMIIRTKIA